MKYFNFYTSQLFAAKEDSADGTGTGDSTDESTDDSTEDGDDSTEDGESEEDDEDAEEEDSEKTEDDEDEKLTPAQEKQARSLLKLLSNKDTRENTILQLATAAGVKVGEQTTRTEVKKDKKKVLDVLTEKLGPEYKFLADKLGPAIEAILEDERNDNKEAFSRVEDKQTENEVQAIETKLNREFKGNFTKLYPKIIKLADQVQPAPGTSTEDYLRLLYKLAATDSGTTVNSKKLADKINRNANDAASRLHGRGTGSGVKKLPENASYKEIVEFSASQVSSTKKK